MDLARFLNQSGDFNKNKKTVKPRALVPRPGDDLKLSVFDIEGLNAEEIWELADEHVVSDRRVKAFARVSEAVLQELGLSVDPDNVPPRHASVIGWPSTEIEQLPVARQLAEKLGECVVLRQ